VTATSDNDSGWGPPRSKIVEWHDPLISAAAVSKMSGLEFLRAIRDGRVPSPPFAKLIGARFADIEVGMVVFECEPDEAFYNPIGLVHGGLVCTLADSVTGCAVQTTLEAGYTFTSIDLNVSYLRAVTKESGRLRATGRITRPGRRVAFASAEIVDGSGKVVATATSSCLVMTPVT
jgi:uncharacterized protein (TIGR00369 family)